MCNSPWRAFLTCSVLAVGEIVSSQLMGNGKVQEQKPRPDLSENLGLPRAITKLDHGGPTDWVAFSPDGRLLVSGSPFLPIRLWDVQTGKEQRTFSGHEATAQRGVFTLAFSFDGGMIAAGSHADRKVHIWEVATGKQLRQFGADGSDSSPVAFSPDGRIIGAGDHSETIHLWDSESGQNLRKLYKNGHGVWCLAFALNGEILASGGYDFTCRLWRVNTGRQIRWFAGHEGPVMSVAFMPDGKTLVSGSQDGTVRLWEVASAKERRRYVGREAVLSVAVSPDGGTVAAGTSRHPMAVAGIALWDVVTGQELCRFGDYQEQVACIAFSPDGTKLAAASRDRQRPVVIWDVSSITRRHQKAVPALEPKKLENLWTDLADSDATKAYDAIWRLTAVPEQTVPFLKQRLKPAVSPDPSRIARLVEKLRSEEFATRADATRELLKIGEPAIPTLRKVLEAPPSLDARKRIEQLLKALEEGTTSQETLRVLRGIEVLERIGTTEVRQVLEGLAKGAEGAPETTEAAAAAKRVLKR